MIVAWILFASSSLVIAISLLQFLAYLWRQDKSVFWGVVVFVSGLTMIITGIVLSQHYYPPQAQQVERIIVR